MVFKKKAKKEVKEPRVAKAAPALNLKALIATMQDYRPLECIRSGIHTIDMIIGKGIPRGRLIEILGDPGTAKSAFAQTAAGAFQRAGGHVIYVDAEEKVDRDFAERLGMDWDAAGHPTVTNIDELISLLNKVSKIAKREVPTLVVVDSFAAIRGIDEIEAIDEDKGMGIDRGQRAKEFSKFFRIILGDLARKQVTLMGTNQVRVNFNFNTGYTTLESTGGKAVKFYAAVRLIMKPKGRIRSRERDLVLGQVIEVESIKNTVSAPFKKAMVHFKFDSGFVPYSGLDELLLRHGRIVQKAGWLCFKDKSFRSADIERICAEMPELLDPLNRVEETPVTTADPVDKGPEDGTIDAATLEEENP